MYKYGTSRKRSNITLNEFNYGMHPNMFSSLIIYNYGLIYEGKFDGIQECATYNPPGPTEPNFWNSVSI